MYFDKKILNHRINNLKQKLEIFNKFKVDFVNIITFDKKFSNFSYLYFIKKIISKKLNCKFIFVSKNFRFGKNREGDIYKLKKFEESLNYKTIITKPLKKINKVLSSSMIRKLISKGEIKKVNQFLGRPWRIEGKVINGKKRGRKIGFPTCNLKIKDYVLPRLGVYAVKVDLANKRKKGIANIGYRPTFNGKSLLLEVNIFGLSKNLYKKTIKVDLIKFIRPEKKFKNINKLKEQIKKDIIIARK
jgi:riboflavin kinase/FMN adenylyltransferase